MVRHCAEECVCVCVRVCVSQSRLFIFTFFEEDVVLRHCAESSLFFASMCVCVLRPVEFKDSFAALKGIRRVEFKDSFAARVFMFQFEAVGTILGSILVSHWSQK